MKKTIKPTKALKLENRDWKVEEIIGTPFTLVTEKYNELTKEKNVPILCIGNEKIKQYDTEKKAIEAIEKTDWDLVAALFIKIYEMQKQIETNKNKKQ